MAAGYPTDKPTVDARMGNSIIALRNQLDDVTRINAWLQGKQDADLVSQGWTSEDVATMKSAFLALAKLSLIANGQSTQAQADDFFFFADRLTGLN
ncbi:hypothetical protein J2Y46_002620 [Microbacterium sp. BE35]|uniref:hypothetical protein n=1 Tax=Microbacterium sp. BE35 TaxID=2817773 RepID=UPI00286019E3|nr:hypothetical protein [Microbacterium sp. BE35]MDR7189794.1 hypothetical protein [Microbacterium sp. BE35]